MGNKDYNNFHEFIIKLQNRVHVLLILPVMIFVFLFIRIENYQFHAYLINRNLRFMIRSSTALLTLIAIATTLIYFNLRIRKIKKNDRLRSRLDRYFNLALKRDYWLTALLLVNLAGMALTAERIYAGFFGISLVVLLSGYPSHSRIMNALDMNREESELAMSKETLE
jgi:hypothetical protein